MNKTPVPPQGLSEVAQRLWNAILEEWLIDDDASRQVLAQGLRALDRCNRCREIIEHDGEKVQDRFGQDKPHPLLAAERDSRAQFFAALRQLKLEDWENGKTPTR